MALLKHSHLLFYPNKESPRDNSISGHFLCGIYSAKPVEKTARVKGPLIDWFFKRTQDLPVQYPEFEFLAAAQVQDVDNVLVVNNIAALKKHGPLMYASLLHFARDEGYKGIRPTLKPDDILKKPREIWEKFSTDPFYSGKVVLKSENQLLEDSEKQSGKYSSEQKPILSRWKHPEDWLNKIYQLQPGSHLVDLAHMRKNAEAYWKHWESTGRSEESLDDFAQKLVRLSIDAHKNK